MEPTTQAVPGYYVWTVPGQAVVIHLHLDVVDRLGADILRGFGALPKRGAEVGGLLLGSIEKSDLTTVRIEDFESVPCQYKRGPSYLFSEDSQELFDQACERWLPSESRPAYAVGYYRSHTRDGPVITPEDIEVMDRYFPFPAHVALLVKPFASRASVASFFIREDGRFPETARVEFPFRRRELAPEPVLEPAGVEAVERAPKPLEQSAWADVPGFARVSTEAEQKPSRPGLPGWIWIPLSFVFLIVGLMLGNLLTRTSNAEREAAFSLALSVKRTGENLTVGWNHDAPAIRAAQKGLLEIEDGGYSKPVELDLAHLQGGSIIYRNSSNRVKFRLIVSLNARSNVTETLEWRQ